MRREDRLSAAVVAAASAVVRAERTVLASAYLVTRPTKKFPLAAAQERLRLAIECLLHAKRCLVRRRQVKKKHAMRAGQAPRYVNG